MMGLRVSRRRRSSVGLCAAVVWCGSALGSVEPSSPSPQEAEPDKNVVELEEIVVYGRAQQQLGNHLSASAGIVAHDDIRLPPLLRVGELVEAVPGMVATQHSGTGKANQYFIRGFNLDHGTDFAVSVEGVPVNLRSHGHGQGYLDLNFLIPELVEKTRYQRGPYAAQVGDFSSAASVEFDLYDHLDESVLTVTSGEFGFQRVLAAASQHDQQTGFTGAVDLTGYRGPWELDERLRQFKLFGAYAGRVGEADLRMTLQGYDSRWTATDQIPQRAVRQGIISRLGNLDEDLGGRSSRLALTGALDLEGFSINAYAVDYDFTLYSNFTYFLEDPLAGDEFEQRDRRRVLGLGLRGENTLRSITPVDAVRWGAEFRWDDAQEVGLYRTAGRRRLGTVRQDRLHEWSLGLWADARWAPTDSLRAMLGLRTDFYGWDVDALREANSGRASDALSSPKATLAWRASDSVETYLNYGRGFHSNDVRGATIAVDPVSGDPAASVPVLVASEGAEVGLRYEAGNDLNVSVTAFRLDLDSELVYVGDAGTTEANGPTRRTGVEASAFWQANDWLALNAAVTATEARFRGPQAGGRRIPGAIASTGTLGLNAAWQNGVSASARLRWLGPAPLVEDNSVRSRSSFLANAGLSYRRQNLELRLDVFNLFNSRDSDVAYFYRSRLPGESAAGVDDVHFHPLEPRSLRGSVSWHWD
ncbi:MAG: TonB-dependent receptor [Pseudomonadota bacterium]